MPAPLVQRIESRYNGQGAKRYIEDLRKMREEMERFAKAQGAKGTDGMASAVREHTNAVREHTRATREQTQAQKEKTRTDRSQADAAVAARSKEAAAIKAMREITALARTEFDKMNLANRRGDLSNEAFARGVAEMRQRVTPQLLSLSQQFEKMPRSVEVAYGRSLVALDRFGTRSTEILTQQTRLRTRITQAIQDAMRMQGSLLASRLPGGSLLMGAGIGGGALLSGGVGLGAAVGIAKATAAAIRYEDALREVRKTTGLTRAGTEALGDDILDLSVKLGMSEIELAKIAATAGQLGISGSRNIIAFTETTAKLAAVSDLTADEAADALGTIANAFDLPIAESERLGSVINGLSNTTAASAADIVDALQRVGPAGRNLGLSVDQVAALTAIMIDMGIESRRAGTSTRNALTLVQTKAGELARVAGMTEQAFRAMLGREPMEAISLYLQALAKLPPQLRTIEIEKTFGQENLLAIQALVSATLDMEGATNKVNSALRESSDLFREQKSLQDEYRIALDTTSGQWGLLKQRMGAWLTETGRPVNDVLRRTLSYLNGISDAVGRNGTPFSVLGMARAFGGRQNTPEEAVPTLPFDRLPFMRTPDPRDFRPPPQGSTPLTIRERIAALEEEREVLLKQGEATDRLAEVNRELVGYRKQLEALQSFGVQDADKEVKAAEQAAAALEKIARAQQIAAAFTKEEVGAMQRVFVAQDRIAELRELQKTLGEDAVRSQMEAAEAELRAAQRALSRAESFRDTIREAAGELNKLQPRFISPVGMLRPPERTTFESEFGIEDGRISGTMLRGVQNLNNEFERLSDNLAKADKNGEGVQETFEGLALSIRTITRVADLFGDLNEDVKDFANGVADAIDNLSRLNIEELADGTRMVDFSQLPQLIGGVAGIASAVVGLGNMLFADGERREAESRRLREALRDSAREFRRAAREAFEGGRVGEGVDPNSLNAVRQIIRILTMPFGIISTAQAEELVSEIEAFGIPGFENLKETVQARLDEILSAMSPDELREPGSVLRALKQALRELLGPDSEFAEHLDALAAGVGEFTGDVAGAVEQLRFFTQFLGEDAQQALKRFTSFLLENVDELNPALRKLIEEAAGLDITTEAGKERLAQIVRTIAAAFPEFLGGLDAGELESILQELKNLAEGTLPSAPAEPEEDPFTATLTNLRGISKAEAAELVFLNAAQLDIQQRILAAITGQAGGFHISPELTGAVNSVLSAPSSTGVSASQLQAITNTGGAVVNNFGDFVNQAPWTNREEMVQMLVADFERYVRRRLPG